ncbi:MAG: hypothetical protein AAFQ12_11850, partial [Pseudomonadota bacterium]
MKRARQTLSYLGFGTCILIVITLLMPYQVQAQSARFTIIDARDGMTPEVVEAYANAMGKNAETALVRSRIKVLTSSRHGFDVVGVNRCGGACFLLDDYSHIDIGLANMIGKLNGPRIKS